MKFLLRYNILIETKYLEYITTPFQMLCCFYTVPAVYI
jgi:hypothetical protein